MLLVYRTFCTVTYNYDIRQARKEKVDTPRNRGKLDKHFYPQLSTLTSFFNQPRHAVDVDGIVSIDPMVKLLSHGHHLLCLFVPRN